MKPFPLPSRVNQAITGALIVLMAVPFNTPFMLLAQPSGPIIVVNQGSPSRGVVTNLSVTLPTNRVLAPLGLVLQSLPGAGTVAPSNMLISVDALAHRYDLTFPRLPAGSVPDGNHLLSVVSTPATNNVGPRESASLPFHRYFGDQDGDRDIDFFDTWFFRETWGEDATSPRFNPQFDADGDGFVSTNDRAHFNSNYFTLLPPQPAVFAHLVLDDGADPADSRVAAITNLAVAGSVFHTNTAARFEAALGTSATGSPLPAGEGAGVRENGPPFVDVTDTLTADSTFTLTAERLVAIHGSALTDGSYDLHLRLVETNDITSATFTLPFAVGENCPFPNLAGWTVNIATNLPPGGVPGSVVADNCEAVLTEGDSFIVALEKTVTIPESLNAQRSTLNAQRPTALAITFALPSFDGTATNLVRDAFEIALVDDNGRPLTYTIAGVGAVPPASVTSPPALPPNPDACFNYTDGQAPVTAPGTALSEISNLKSQIAIDVAHLAPGTPARLILRLVNNDRDRATTVRILDVRFDPASPGGSLAGTDSTAFSAVNVAATGNSTGSPSSMLPKPELASPAPAAPDMTEPLPGHPLLVVSSPVDGSSLPAATYLLAGTATPGTTNTPPGSAEGDGPGVGADANRIVLVTVNGVPAEALDAAGNFFTRIEVRPGLNTFEVVAEDAFSQRTTNQVAVLGTTAANAPSNLAVVSASIQPEYGRTTFNEKTGTLYADLALRNPGTYPIKAPFYVGITRISDPTVGLLAADGTTADGIPYYDFSATIENGVLYPASDSRFTNHVSRSRTIAFVNPNHVQFTYELVVLAQLNHAPYFTTAPLLEAIVGKPYTYGAVAVDPDTDPLTFSLLSAPIGLTLTSCSPSPGGEGRGEGVLSWTPTENDLGNHDITLQASDGRGGTAQQHYLLTVITPPSNRPPHFVSSPVTTALVSTNTAGTAVTADLAGWAHVQMNDGFQPPANWVRSGSNTVATQIVNADPSILLSDFQLEDTEIEGTWRVSSKDGDNDFMGFAFGYQNSEHFYLFDWKKGDQHHRGFAERGMNVKVVFADTPLTGSDLWPTAGNGARVRSLYHNTIPWNHDTDYSFMLVFRTGEFTITVREGSNTLASLSVNDATYTDGGFGFYNYSQGQVQYTGFTRRALPVTTYAYDADAVDPDGDTLTYSLAVAPTNMTINPVTGLIRWGPATNDLGQHSVTVQVVDGRGGTNWQSYTVCVLPGDQPPSIVHQPLDLTAAAVDASGVTADGQTLLASGSVSARITNLGPRATLGPFEVSFFEDRNRNGAFDATNDVVLGRTTVMDSLAAGESRTVTATVFGPVLFPGNVIWAFVDSRNEIAETDEANNLANSGMDCLTQPVVGQFNPVVRLHALTNMDIATTPYVANLTDDNGDGRIDENDTPDIILSTAPSGNQFNGGPIIAVSGEDGHEIIRTATSNFVAALCELAVGDIDGDGVPEIVAAHVNGRQLIAFEHTGDFKWLSTERTLPGRYDSGGAISITDLDGDGVPEIVVGSSVYGPNGVLLADGRDLGGHTGYNYYTCISAVADVDLDGVPEIIAGPSAYRYQHGVLTRVWHRADLPDGFVGVANFDSDPHAEIVLVASGRVYMLNDDGSDAAAWLGPVNLQGGGPGGAPTIGDFDGDRQPEIGIADRYYYAVYDSDGTRLWSQPTQETSSGVTGSTSFDFDGDGRAEIVYRDETRLRVYRGTDGTVLFQMAVSSGTGTEYPVVVDVDNDGNAEIVTTANRLVGRGPQQGVYVIGDANDTWVNTRRIWNQHTYHINNVNDDGTIPRYEEPSWLTHNTYRLNLQPGQNPLAAPDLVAAYVRAAETNGEATLTVRIGNGGAVLAPAEVFVACYAGDPHLGGTFLGRGATTARIVPGAFEDVSIMLTNAATGDLWVVADDDGTGKGKVNECQEGNNFYRPGFALPLVNHAPTIASAPVTEAAEGQSYLYDVQAADPDPGDTLSFSLAVAPDGMTVAPLTGVISWTPGAAQAGYHAVQMTVADDRGAQAIQQFLVHVADQLNASPTFVSTSPTNALPNQTLQYNALVRDPDGDVLTFDLITAPAGMIVETNTGVVAWRPLFAQLGTHDVMLRAQDGRGGVALQSWHITVSAPNTPPVIVSIPPGPAVAGLPYRYHVRAQDAEGQPLTFTLGTNAPAGMTLTNLPTADDASPSPLGGERAGVRGAVLSWTPDTNQVGLNPIEITVRDTAGDETQQAFDLEVLISAVNTAPYFTTAPRTQTRVGTPWVYVAAAADSDGDPLSFALTEAPAGLTLTNASNGLASLDSVVLSWTPTALGAFPVALTVNDSRGGVVTQAFVLTVSSTLDNQAPLIVSTPPVSATVAQPYAYDAVAQDADGDEVTWRLVSGPLGLSMNALSGALRWVPTTDQMGTNAVVIEAQDGFLATGQQSFTIEVGCANRSPQITSVPPVMANAGQPYLYTPRATDPDGDRLSWSLIAPAPAGMAIDTTNGLIRWTPGTDQVGSYSVQVRASDERGGSDTQLYGLRVVDQRANHNPAIVSTPSRGTTAGRPYNYLVRATDADGDALTFLPITLPAGATLTPQTGAPNEAVVTWTPAEAQLGPNDFTLAVRDTVGGSAAQRFTVWVRANEPPTITSQPTTNAAPNLTWRYDVAAFDPEGDALSYALLTGPPGFTMDSLGRMAWTPSTNQLGSHPVALSVTDFYGLSATQAFTVTVVADTEPPVVTLEIAYNLSDEAGNRYVQAGSIIGIGVRATDNVGVASRELRIAGSPVALGADFSAQVPFPAAGTFEAVATAADASGNTATSTNLIPVVDPSAMSSVSVVIHSPTNTAEVLKPVPVLATILSSNAPLGEIILDYAEMTSEAAAAESMSHPSLIYQQLTNFWAAPGTYALSNANLGTFDPTILQNGSYVIRVTAYDINRKGRQQGVLVNVNGNLKFGEFRLEFTDLAVPVAGVPVTITRVYDSRDSRRVGDFGYGWSLKAQSARIVETAKKPFSSFGWQESTFTTATRVYLTDPDGKRVGFSFTPEPAMYALFFGVLYRPAFTADPGVYDRLEPLDATAGWQIRGDGAIVGGFGLANYDPSGYRLVMKDGTSCVYDEQAGLQHVTDPNGNRLVFTRNGIFHYSAGSTTADQQVPFIRDAQGRITQIVGPAGKPLTYTYDGAGDLRTFTDQATNLTQYAYSTARPHFLTNIVDPLGRQALRMEYDASGRLTTIRDALGNPIEQNFDLDSNTLTFKDANGHTNIARYDDNGNEVMKAMPGIYTNYFQFDANNNEIWRQDGRGFVTTRAYDTRGNLTQIVDAASNVTAIAYNDLNKPTHVSDALGRPTEFRYNERGDLTNVINALGGQAFFTRDSQGRVTSVTDFNGHTTTYDYTGGCSCGKPGKVINPDGTFRLYDYNALGQTTREVNELGHETLSNYDDAGRLLWVRDAEGHTTQYTYAGALKTSETDPLGRTTWYAYDDANRQIAITNALGGVVRFEYDNGTNRTAVIDPVGNVTRFYYDAANRLSHQVDPWGRTNLFSYDAAGNRTEAIDRNGRKRTFGYDALNRRTNELWWEGTNVVRSIEFGFNALGIMTGASDPASRLAFDFDPLNRLERATQSGVAGMPDFSLTYGYDGMTNVVTVADNWGAQVASEYNARNQLVRRVWQGGGLPGASLRFEYDAAGNRTNTLRYADAAGTSLAGQSHYGFSPLGLITDILHANATGSPLAEYHYERDPAQQILQRTINHQLSAYSYDNTGQLTNATYSADQPNESYHFDANGNRIGGGYVVTTNNQIVADGTNIYSYDVEGSMVGRSNTVTHATTAYHYDHRNRLVSVVDKDAGGTVTQTVEFTYDALNRRTAKSVNGTVTRFLLNQQNVWADANGVGAVTARYLLGNRIDEMLARYRPGEAVVWYLTDNLGTVRDLADSAGLVVNHLNYDSYGRVQVQTVPTVGDRFLYTGRELDADTGLLFYRARYFSPDLGRFLCEDPIGFSAGDWNLYRYCGNAPVTLTDASGTGVVALGYAILTGRYGLYSAATQAALRASAVRSLAVIGCLLALAGGVYAGDPFAFFGAVAACVAGVLSGWGGG